MPGNPQVATTSYNQKWPMLLLSLQKMRSIEIHAMYCDGQNLSMVPVQANSVSAHEEHDLLLFPYQQSHYLGLPI